MKRLSWVALVCALTVSIGSVFAVQRTAEAAVATTTIQDTAQGAGVGQVQFSSGWSPCSGNCGKAASDNSFQWTSTAGSSVTVRFSGSQIKLYGVKEPWAYIATAAIDGGTPVDVDYYAAAVTSSTVEVYSSPTLSEGTHTLVLTMTNRKNAASSGGNSITFDRAEVVSGNPRASGMPWSDGGYFEHDGAKAAAFQEWRGRPVDNIVAFAARETWGNLLSTWWTQSLPDSFAPERDDLIISVPLWTEKEAASAKMGTDANWTQLAQGIAEADPNAYVRLGWEMNCCEFSKATAGQESIWRNQFSRAATLIKAAAPGLKIVFNPNEGKSQDGTFVQDVSTLFVDGKVDVIALDAYDWWQPYNSDANANNHFTKQYGWNWWYNFARSKGLPFAIAEFSVYSGSADSGGDNPAYFTHVYNWLSSKNNAAPGSIAFVSVYNESAEYCGCNLFPTNPNPNAAQRYRSIIQSLSQ